MLNASDSGQSAVEPMLATQTDGGDRPESQRMLATLLANLPGMAYRCRNDAHWTMEFVSEGCRDLTGYPAERLVGDRAISYETIIHPEDRAWVRSEVEAACRVGRRFELTYRIVTAEGSERWVLERGIAISVAPSPECLIEGIVLDITERKCAEEALAENERMLSAILDHSFEFIGLLDVEGRLLSSNQTSLDAIGAKMEDVEGKFFWDTPWWAHSVDEQQRLRAGIKRAAQGGFVRYETTHPTADGRLLMIDFSLKPVKDSQGRVVTIIPEGRDVTEQKGTEQALRESEGKFAKAFSASPYPLSISDLTTGRYMDLNEAFAQLSGYTREEMIGRTSLELGLWVRPEERAELIRRLKTDGRVRGMELRFIARGGREIATRCSCELLEVGGRPAILNTIEDITGQREAEEARTQLEGQLRQAQKLEALGQLAGGIAHDFNNILTGVFAFTELATLDLDQPDEARKHLAEVRKAGNRAKELVRQILAFSRQQIQERKPIRLQPVLAEAINLLRSSLPATIEIDTQLDADAPVVLADATEIHQVIMNLGTNAAHAMQERAGRLSVRFAAEVLDEAACRARPGLRPGMHAVLTVEDTGAGMDAATLKRIFEPFFTTKGPGEGTGLGLAVVHGIVENHDGVMTVRSELGVGTTFQILLPEHRALELGTEAESVALPRGAGERVLFIDDEQMICDAGRLLLERLGYRVTAHTDPRAAVEWFARHPTDFDLLVTDLTMPRLTGIEVVHQLRALRPELPVLLASGYSARWTPESFRALGVSGLISKPMTSPALAQAVRRALDGRPAAR